MAWHLVERSNGQTLRGTYGSRDEAETFRAELVAEDAGYDDVLFIRWDGGDESEPEPEPEPEAEPEPPPKAA